MRRKGITNSPQPLRSTHRGIGIDIRSKSRQESSGTLIILIDPPSITVIYGKTTSAPVPEFPALESVVLVGCLAVTLIIEKNLTNIRQASLRAEQDDSEND